MSVVQSALAGAASRPTSSARLIGRDSALRELRELLASRRLITLTGPTGSGKTALARHAAVSQPEAAWIDLSAVTDPAYVSMAVAGQLGIDVDAEQPPLDGVAKALRDSEAVLVFDNCEHVVAAVAAVCSALLVSCARVRIVATSLQPLGVAGERVLAVPPLSTAPAQGALSDAAALFVERARDIEPGFAPSTEDLAHIEAVCARLDGLPLAIELAAARLRMLSVAQIAARLDDALGLLARGTPAQERRHRTLRAVLDWSHGLLSPAQHVLFRRLGVFPGSFTVEHMEAVAGVPAALDTLTDLADRSLVQIEARPEGKRFRLLLVIAQYARERLEAAGEAGDVKTRLLRWLADWMESVEPHLTGPDQTAWYGRIAMEEDACRAMLRWACTSRQPELGLRLANALWRFWLWRDQLMEGRAWLNELLALDAGRAVAPAVRAQALFGAGRIACRQGDDDTASRQGHESLAIFRDERHQPGQVRALSLLALVAQDRGEVAVATEHYTEALDLSRRIGDVYYTGVLLVNLGLLHHGLAELERAEACFREAAALAHPDSQAGRAALGNVADVLLRRGDLAGAARVLEDVIARDTALGNRAASASALVTLAEVVWHLRDAGRAEALAREALHLHEQSGAVTGQCDDHIVLGQVLAASDTSGARRHFGLALSAADRSAYALGRCRAEVGLARLEVAEAASGKAMALAQAALQRARTAGARLADLDAAEAWAEAVEACEPALAARLVEAAAAARERHGLAALPVDRARRDALRARLAGRLSPEYDALSTAARAEGLDAVIGRALHPPAAGRAVTEAVGGAARLRIGLLGPVVVEVAGAAIPHTAWTYAKSRELVLYLAARGPSGKDQIGVDLWPDATPSQVRSNFHRALYHARRALGGEGWIVFAGGRYALRPGDDTWCDVREFDRIAGAVRPADEIRPHDRPAVIAQLDRAAALWRGEPLQDVDTGEWGIFLRETERVRMMRLLTHLGALHLADARYDPASAAYRRLLDLDPYYELAHRELMRCMARQGEAGQAVRHYARLRSALDCELGAAPSLETTLLYERIRRGEVV